jgi:Tol biopolymer transport system component
MVQTLVRGGFSPDLSPDGATLAFVAPSRGSANDRLYTTPVDGGDVALVAGSDQFVTVDAPRFSSDGGWILFSGDQSPFAATPSANSEPGIDWTLVLGGVKAASAHTTPTSDLWRLPATGGTPTRLVRLLADGISADTSPDGAHIAFVTVLGLYVANADGSGAARIDTARYTSVQWLPD